jgi:hypothetical protein
MWALPPAQNTASAGITTIRIAILDDKYVIAGLGEGMYSPNTILVSFALLGTFTD